MAADAAWSEGTVGINSVQPQTGWITGNPPSPSQWNAASQSNLGSLLSSVPDLNLLDVADAPRRVLTDDYPYVVPNPNGQGWDMVYPYYSAYQGDGELLIVDFATGEENRQVWGANEGDVITTLNPDFHMKPAFYLDNKLVFHLFAKGQGLYGLALMLMVYDPALNAVTHWDVPDPEGPATNVEVGFFDMTESGMLYGIGYDEFKDGFIPVSFDPKTYETVTHSKSDIGTYRQTYSLYYGQSVAVTEPDGDYVYAKVGKEPWRLVTYNFTTGTGKVLAETTVIDGDHKTIVMNEIEGGVMGTVENARWIDGIGNVSGSFDFWLRGGKIYRRTGDVPPWSNERYVAAGSPEFDWDRPNQVWPDNFDPPIKASIASVASEASDVVVMMKDATLSRKDSGKPGWNMMDIPTAYESTVIVSDSSLKSSDNGIATVDVTFSEAGTYYLYYLAHGIDIDNDGLGDNDLLRFSANNTGATPFSSSTWKTDNQIRNFDFQWLRAFDHRHHNGFIYTVDPADVGKSYSFKIQTVDPGVCLNAILFSKNPNKSVEQLPRFAWDDAEPIDHTGRVELDYTMGANEGVLEYTVDLYDGVVFMLKEINDQVLFANDESYGQHVFYDLENETSQRILVALSPYSLGLADTELYVSGYPNSKIWKYDLLKPFESIGNPDSTNPELIGYLGAENLSDTHVPLGGTIAGADGAVYNAGATYGRTRDGGGLGWYDRDSGSLSGIQMDETVFWMTPTNDRRYILLSTKEGGSSTYRQLQLWDTTTKSFKYRKQYSEFYRGGPVVEALPGLVMGYGSHPSNDSAGVLYGLNAVTGEILWTKPVPDAPATGLAEVKRHRYTFRRGPEGYVWANIGKTLVKIDPRNGMIDPVGKLPSNPGPVAFANNEVYLGGGTKLQKLQGISVNTTAGSEIETPVPTNSAPVANAGGNVTVQDSDGNGTETVTLSAGGSSDADGTIQSYTWRENGSVLSTVANPSIPFSVGVHNVFLTVTDNDGATATDSVTVTVNAVVVSNSAPTAKAGNDVTVEDSDGNGSETVNLNASGSTDSDGTIQSYTWTLNGSVVAAVANPTITFPTGVHNVVLMVTDNDGANATDTVRITVQEGAPLPPASESGRTWVVNQNHSSASDNNSGTASAPLKTIQAGADKAQPGDTVLVYSGEYRERVTPPRGGSSESERITYKVADGHTVKIMGSDKWNPNWQQEVQNVYYAKPASSLFTDDVYRSSPNPFSEKMMGHKFYCGLVFVNGVMYKPKVAINDVRNNPNTFHVSSDGKIYIHFPGGSPSGNDVEITTRRKAFGPNAKGLGYITVDGFIMERVGNQSNKWVGTGTHMVWGALDVAGGHHWTIENNIVRHVNSVGIDGGGYAEDGYEQRVTSGSIRSSHNIIRNNLVEWCGQLGISVSLKYNGSGGHCQIVGNVVNHANWHEFDVHENAAIKTHQFNDSIIADNLVMNTHPGVSGSIWVDYHWDNTRITGNLLINSSPGIYTEFGRTGDNVLVDNNILIDCEIPFKKGNIKESPVISYQNNLVLKSGHSMNNGTLVISDHPGSENQPSPNGNSLDNNIEVRPTSGNGNYFRFDLETFTLDWKLGQSPSYTGRDDPESSTDYFGNPVNAGNPKLGPFADLRQGTNSWVLWPKSGVSTPPSDNPPNANAGADIIQTDLDGNGSENISLDGSASFDSDGTIESYVWNRGNDQIATGVSPTVSLPVGTHTIVLTVTDNDGLISVDPVTVTVEGRDTTPPSLVSASASAGGTTVTLVYSERVTTATAGNASNYTINNGISVTSASLGSDKKTVTLTTTPLADTGNYLVTVRNVRDEAGNTVASGTQIAFTYTASEASLMFHWKLDETGGSLAADESGNGNNGTVSGARWDSNGQFDGALAFDGNNDYVSAGNLNLSNRTLTVSAWIKADAIGNRLPIIGKQGNGKRGFLLMVDANKETLCAELYDGSSDRSEVVGSTKLQANRWYHVAMTYEYVNDGSSKVRLYVDGEQDASSNGVVGPLNQNTQALELGRYFWSNSYNVHFDGLIDDVRVYDRVLSASEIDDLKTGATAPVNQAPVADAGDDKTVTDFDGNGSQPVTLNGNGSSDPDGTIQSYVWYEGGNPVGFGNAPIVNLGVGIHALTLQVTDNMGAKATDVVIITVNGAPNEAPSVSITSPANNSTISAGDSFTVTVQASDSDGLISKVELYQAGAKIGEDRNAPYAFTVNTFGAGELVLTAKATDNDGASTTSSPVRITAVAPVNLEPVADAGSNISVTDTDRDGVETVRLDGSGSRDPDGTSLTYAWKEGGVAIATGANPEIIFAVGTHTLILEVTDSEGATDTDTVVITVSPVEDVDFFLFEAEDYSRISSGPHAWIQKTATGGYAGAGYMETTPNTGRKMEWNTASNPQLGYTLNFPSAGTYYVWIRGTGGSWSDDSVHYGLDGIYTGSIDLDHSDNFEWSSELASSGIPANILVVPSAGLHEFTIRMREDGAKVDRVVITAEADWSPVGNDTVATVDPSTGNNLAPEASNVTYIGNLVEGDSLTAVYDYSDGDGDAEGQSIINWYRSSDAVLDPGDPVIGNNTTLNLGTADTGSYIFLEVIPVAVTGVTQGKPTRAFKFIPVAYTTYLGFLNASDLEGAESQEGADPDGDGLGNLYEYAFNSSAMVHSTQDGAQIYFARLDGQPCFCMSYRRNLLATDLTYDVEYSSDLQNWYLLNPQPGNITVTQIDEETEQVNVWLPVLNNQNTFLRVSVTRK